MLSINPSDIPVPQLHAYLLGAVGPRPIAFASTVDKDGNPNLAPFSFFNVFSSRPPLLIFSPNRSGRTGETKQTHDNVKEVPEVVINIVSYRMVHQMSLTSSPYAKGVDEFLKAGFTKLASEKVKPFRVAESPVQLECKVLEVKELGTSGGAGNLIICEVVKMHISEEVLNENGVIDQQKIDLVARMGGNWYCRASGDALFEVQKPITTLGLGVDILPPAIRNSKVLSGNDLGQLGNLEQMPTDEEVEQYKNGLTPFTDEVSFHQKIKELISKGTIREAWLLMLSQSIVNK
ncbi:MAG: flavin reductase [Bacteroidetes bacterium]|jgi:flavin reductase (DIM6/NTAB) family NADH-FMN oxidoreductase RutF|nr:flavin reductase [Bacteroidota bacterium]